MRAAFPLLLTASLLLSAGAAMADPASPKIITMSGHGELRAAPDTASLSAGVTAQAPTAQAAIAADNSRMQAVLAAVKKLGVPDKDVRTENFSLSPQYADANNNQARRIIGYQVSNQVTVRLEDVSKLGVALDALIAAGANQMNGVNFSIRDDAAMLTQAREAAVAQARAKAETFARAAGVSLGAILSISENGNEGPRPIFAPMMMRAAKPVPVAVGEQSVGADVTIIWEIK